MDAPDQREVIEFLSSPAAHGGRSVERIDTHTAVLFLAGATAWKLKRAVAFDYVDFSTLERRRAMCDAEVALNRRTAPQIYRGVTPVTREAGGALALGGTGAAVEWLVEMNRFDQDELLDRLAARGALDLSLMEALARAVATFHAGADVRPEHGGASSMTWVVAGNDAGFAEFGRFLDPAACRRVTEASHAEIARLASALDARREGGFVRQCHGDLHLRNIVRLHGEPTLFDAIEFNDELACIDVWYDTAFLLMDLWRRGLRRHANVLFNRYLDISGDVEGVSLLPLFLSCRAAVRAKTSATAASFQRDSHGREPLEALGRQYLELAEALLRPVAPRVIAIGGLSGTGKSTVARATAPSIGAAPGAVVLRSDEIRKAQWGVGPLDRLPGEAYTPEASARVYTALREQASRIVRQGHSAIVDAVFARAADRDEIERTAVEAGARFTGIWLHAPEPALVARIEGRSGDASDADAAVLRAQLAVPAGEIRWRPIDASAGPEDVQKAVLAAVGG